MSIRFTLRGAAFSASCLVASTLLRPLSAQTPEGGSEVPCAAPLAWRVTRVDREFGLDVDRATEVVRQAADLWQGAAVGPLFRHDPAEGFPIRLVYDERQERTQDRMRRQTEVDRATERWQELRDDLLARAARHSDAERAHSDRLRDFERRVAAHNDEVRSWNGRGGAPEDVRVQLEAVGATLATEREDLERTARSLDAEQAPLLEAEDSVNRAGEERDRLAQALARDFPSVPIESGVYREAIRTEGGRVASVSREIRIFRFAGDDELRLVAAHELGHALGLGHGPAGPGVMSAEHHAGTGATYVTALADSDQRLLRSRCPGLVRGGR